MENICLTLFGWMHLMTFKILAIIFATLTVLAIILMITSKMILSRKCLDTEENDNISVTKLAGTEQQKLKKQINICYASAITSLIITSIAMLIYLYFNGMALTYSAYENVQLAQTLDEIAECARQGFIESDLPDELGGSIVIYFKYGCPDCAGIKDRLMQSISENNVKDIYFVSSRSKQGKDLLAKYPVDEVPAGIYIRKKESDISDMYAEILYIKKTDTNTGTSTSVFDEDAFMHLLYRQKEQE